MVTYGSLTLAETSPPQTFTEPLTLAQVKKFLLIPDRSPADDEEDDLIEDMITAARVEAELCQGRDLVEKVWEWYGDYFPTEFTLREPLVSIDLLRYRDSDGEWTELDLDTHYIVDTWRNPAVVIPPYGEAWPDFTAYPTSAVHLRFTSGYTANSVYWSDIGKLVRKGMLMLISEWFNNRLPMSYDIAAGGSTTVNRIRDCLSAGGRKVVY